MSFAPRSPYRAVANVYDAFLTITGFRRGVENFLDRLGLDFPPRARLLDAGCGTGLMARWLAKRFPNVSIIAADIDARMLREMERIVAREGIDSDRITIAQSDLRTPEQLHLLRSQETVVVPENYFDGIVVSGALEHVPLEPAVARLGKLLKPGGIFLNIGLRRSPAGAMLGMMYGAKPYRIAQLRRACERAGFEDIQVIRLSVEDFPANLSRIAIMARKGARVVE